MNDSSHKEQSNVGIRKDILLKAMKEIVAKEDEMGTLRAELHEIKNKKIKGDLGMKIADFNILKRAYKLEDKDRDQFMDTLREGWAALGIGGQLDFISALDPAEPTA